MLFENFAVGLLLSGIAIVPAVVRVLGAASCVLCSLCFLRFLQHNGYGFGGVIKSLAATSKYFFVSYLLIVAELVLRAVFKEKSIALFSLTLNASELMSISVWLAEAALCTVFFIIYARKEYRKRLVFTARVVRICVCEALVALCLSLFSPSLAFFAIPILPYSAVVLLTPVEYAIMRYYIRKGKRKLRQVKPFVIAVTGSYGKTSVKNMIGGVLSESFPTVISPDSFNTPSGVALTLNRHMKSDTRVLVLEMGARRKGDIAELCKIAPPDMAIITGVTAQHLQTFKTIEAIVQTKTEVCHNMKRGGIVLFDGDNPRLADRIAEIESINPKHAIFLPVKICAFVDTKSLFSEVKSDKFAEKQEITDVARTVKVCNGAFVEAAASPEVRESPDGFTREVILNVDGKLLKAAQARFRKNFDTKNQSRETQSPKKQVEAMRLNPKIVGKYAQNIAFAAGAARIMGVSAVEVSDRINRLPQIPHRLEVYRKNDIIIVDDSYNANIEGVACAVELVKQLGHRRHVLTCGIVELGKRQYEENYRLGRLLGFCDIVTVFGQNTVALSAGARSVGRCKVISVGDVFEGVKKLRDIMQKGDVLLFLNDIPDTE
ncbi:MAG: UDP-N-acetylmuramoyl-tripeptide--D-alanyl-D-alanine ligase [Clostridia bacterium]|nr:UDP-N-acetylmuramoyl-tripeptide--D-alanyl-D-alanine ligase [Clostridia bacterium]